MKTSRFTTGQIIGLIKHVFTHAEYDSWKPSDTTRPATPKR